MKKDNVFAWAVERDTDPTFPRLYMIEDEADAMVEYVNVNPPARKIALYRSTPATPAGVGVDEKCVAYRNALLWAFDRLNVTGGMNADEQRRTMREIGSVLTGKTSPAATYQPNDWDDSTALLSRRSGKS